MLLTIDHPCMSLCSCHFRNGHLEIVRHLVASCGVDVNIKDDDGDTPLHKACGYVYTLMVHSSLLSSPVHFTTVS